MPPTPNPPWARTPAIDRDRWVGSSLLSHARQNIPSPLPSNSAWIAYSTDYVVWHTAITMFRPPVCRATLTISRFGTPAPSTLNTRYPIASSPSLSVSGALSFKFQ
ncbi:unnamed protein product [Ectocarpus sp. 12 AP-2014]